MLGGSALIPVKTMLLVESFCPPDRLAEPVTPLLPAPEVAEIDQDVPLLLL